MFCRLHHPTLSKIEVTTIRPVQREDLGTILEIQCYDFVIINIVIYNFQIINYLIFLKIHNGFTQSLTQIPENKIIYQFSQRKHLLAVASMVVLRPGVAAEVV